MTSRRIRFTTVSACAAALIAIIATSADAIVGSNHALPSTVSERTKEFQVNPGNFITGVTDCPGGQYALSGGYSLLSGNFFWVTTAGTSRDEGGYVLAGFVPNKIAEPGAVRARIRVKVVCAKEGRAVVP